MNVYAFRDAKNLMETFCINELNLSYDECSCHIGWYYTTIYLPDLTLYTTSLILKKCSDKSEIITADRNEGGGFLVEIHDYCLFDNTKNDVDDDSEYIQIKFNTKPVDKFLGISENESRIEMILSEMADYGIKLSEVEYWNKEV